MIHVSKKFVFWSIGIFMSLFLIVVVLEMVVIAANMGNLGWLLEEKSQPYRITPDTFESEKKIQDWTTYRNEEFGFEIKVPPGCVVEKNIFPQEGTNSFSSAVFSVNQTCYGGEEGMNGGASIAIFHDVSVFNSMAICRERIVEVQGDRPLSEALLCYQNLPRGTTTYDYPFTRKGWGYKFSTMHLDKTYNIKIEKAIFESFRFIEEKR